MPKLYEIVEKQDLVPGMALFHVYAPMAAKNMKPGQFIILRVNAKGERIPISISGWDSEKGTIRIIIMAAGRTSTEAVALKQGECFQDIVGPLGEQTHLEKVSGTAVVVGGGYGTGAVMPPARAMKAMGNRVVGIIGARSKDLVLLEAEMREVCDDVIVCTNDGSQGVEGFVTDGLKQLMEKEDVSWVLSVGPVPMMQAVANLTKPKEVKTYCSLNAIMVDGTGMCGACRVSVGGKTKFACFHGPDFDAHQVNFEELVQRQKMFLEQEKIAMEKLEEVK
ncbi:sulfide/dihydroorotate dehydrogenase-like FAD/NAD-binding protein [Desulfurispira natronophila]|uniref:Ferredoxin--NADP+ reductase n=1 Tax=Desulfurispira natronophila TaxID=682562 RepID=A0A7W8DH26_9BACT|nr:sulfide/dihydroorotate dehydrogenase-like FAD/NAD-binding protein [Desulfurispira natronophila]MBB5021974.1 ferredoxin--NADP+ reductase [Desulfurispira natronophila]